jgi:hypothetical protein
MAGEPRANGATSGKQESTLVRWIATYYMQTLEQLGGSQSGEQTKAVECLFFQLKNKDENSHDDEHASLKL